MAEERLIGFDVREPRTKLPQRWHQTRRQMFLLRPDAATPLSTDTLVWPSVFDTGQGIGLPEQQRIQLGLAGVTMPAKIGSGAGLWDDASAMLRYLAEHSIEPGPAAVIAVSWLSDRGFSDAGIYGPCLADTTPAVRDRSWQLLGFDVSDGSLLSGLSNCGYTAAEGQLLRPTWGPLLNESHLFPDTTRAFEYREITNARVPKHAPFFVFGLYLMQEVLLTVPGRRQELKR